MGKVVCTETAGSIVRRVREDARISRAELASKCGIGARSLYALEMGEAENFGLGRYLRLLDALGLSMSVDYKSADSKNTTPATANDDDIRRAIHWDDLASIWHLDEGAHDDQ